MWNAHLLNRHVLLCHIYLRNNMIGDVVAKAGRRFGFMPRVGRQTVAPWLVVLCLAVVQGAVELAGGIPDPAIWKWYVALGLTGDGLFYHGRFWQVISYAWLHGGLAHLSINGLCIGIAGSQVDRMLGWKVFVSVCLAGILGGAAGHLSLASWSQDEAPLVGASGACMALLLLITTLSPESRMWPLPLSARNVGLGVFLAEAVLVVIDPSHGVAGFSAAGSWLVCRGMGSWFQIGHACHLGGCLAGWLSARWLLRPRWTLKKLRRERARLEARAVRD